jgi:actin-like ATPase involved in cell morphogenesis
MRSSARFWRPGTDALTCRDTVSAVTAPFESRLGIDLGTTHTVASLSGADGRSQPLLFDASFLLPSCVYAETDGRLLVGRDAERSAKLDPTRFEPNPKRRIDDGTVLLGSREYPVADLLAAVLRRAGDEAARVAGQMPARTVLTYPAHWANSRKGVLADAAGRAGLPAVTLIPEPIAAAMYFTTILGRHVAPGMALVVYDFGGGTFDTSVLRRRPDYGWEVLVSDGLNDVGGVDLDAAIIAHLERNLGAHDAEMWHRLTEPADDNARRRHRMLWEEVRAAKEQLSRSSSAGVHVPLFDTDVYLTREEFERVARPYLERTVDLAANSLQRAGVRHDQVAGLFPVGGSSRIPLVNTLLHHRLGVAPTLIEQPELVVALGSVLALGPIPGSGYQAGAVRQPMSAGPVPPPGPPPAWGPPGSPGVPAGFGTPAGPPAGFGTPAGPPAGPRVSPGVGAGAGMAAAAGLGAAAASVSPTAGPATPVSSPIASPVSGPGSGPVSVPPTSSSVSPPFGAAGPVSAPPGSTSDSTAAFATEPVTAAMGAEAPPSGLYPPPPPVGSGYSSAPLGPPPRSGGGGKMGLIAAVVVVALLLVGGGTALAWKVVSNASKSGDKSRDNSSTNTNTNAGSGSGSTNGNKGNQGAGKQHAEVNKSAWYANFKFTFGAIDYDPAEETMTAEILVENQGSENKSPGVDMTFSVGDKHFDGGPKDSINVDAGQKSNVVFEFRMNDFAGNINDGLFTIGDSKTAQATVPVTDKGELVAYEPKNLVKDKMVTDRDLNIWYTTCDLRGGFFNFKGQADKGYLAITCSVVMQYTGGSAAGHYVGADNFALGLPDGTEVGPTVAPNEALYSAERVPNTQLGFQVKAPVKGTYKLRVVDVHAGKTRSDADVKEVPITIS